MLAAISFAVLGSSGAAVASAPDSYGQWALFVTGTLVPGSTYGSGAGTQQNTGQANVSVPAGGVVTLRNHSSAAAVGLATPIRGTQATMNASVVIERLG